MALPLNTAIFGLNWPNFSRNTWNTKKCFLNLDLKRSEEGRRPTERSVFKFRYKTREIWKKFCGISIWIFPHFLLGKRRRHSVWKSRIQSHLRLRAKRAIFAFLSVTRQFNFSWVKLVENAKTGNIKCDIFGRFSNTMEEKIAGKFKYYHFDPFQKRPRNVSPTLKGHYPTFYPCHTEHLTTKLKLWLMLVCT